MNLKAQETPVEATVKEDSQAARVRDVVASADGPTRNREIARRAVAARGFRWMPGMRLKSGFRVVAVGIDGVPICAEESDGGRRPHRREKGLLLDTDDPATRGCLLELVRDWLEDVGAYTEIDWTYDDPVWNCVSGVEIFPPTDTEAGALVAALEAVS